MAQNDGRQPRTAAASDLTTAQVKPDNSRATKSKSNAVKDRLDDTPQTRSFLPEDFMEEEKILSTRRKTDKSTKKSNSAATPS